LPNATSRSMISAGVKAAELLVKWPGQMPKT
jgi:hypothetical protein